MIKKCTKCGKLKPITEFHRDSRRNSLCKSHCRECIKKYRSKHYFETKGPEICNLRDRHVKLFGTYKIDFIHKTRKCKTCGEIKGLSEFRKDPRYDTVYSGSCKKCELIKVRDSAKRRGVCLWKHGKNKQKETVEYIYNCIICGKEFKTLQKNKKLCSNKECKRKHSANKTRIRYSNNKQKERDRVRSYKHSNPDKCKEWNDIRWERIHDNNVGDITRDYIDGIIKVTKTCPYCGKRIGDDDKSIDHIIPVSKGGEHSRDNIIVCCKKCNIKKSNKYISIDLMKKIKDYRNKTYMNKGIDIVKQLRMF